MSLFDALANYNAERQRGLVHSVQWRSFMAQVQDLWLLKGEPWVDRLDRDGKFTVEPNGDVFIIWPYSLSDPDGNVRISAWVQETRDRIDATKEPA